MPTLQLHLTNCCNLYCLHCYGDYGHSNNKFIQVSLAKKIFDDLVSLSNIMGDYAVAAIGGGEPLLHPDFITIIDYASKYLDHVMILTNGMRLDKKVATYLSKMHNISVQISIEGTLPTHNLIRGGGTYEKAQIAIGIMKKYKIPVVASMTVNAINFNEIEYFLNYCKNMQIRPILHRYIPIGRGAEKLALSYEQIINLNNFVLKVEIDYNIEPHCTLCSIIAMTNDEVESRECNIGKNCIVVNESGDVILCPYIDISVGSVLENSLFKILLTSPEMIRMRERNFGTVCISCVNKNRCGGCRAMSYSKNGDIYGDDPYCPNVRNCINCS